jgi:hypothetical protein
MTFVACDEKGLLYQGSVCKIGFEQPQLYASQQGNPSEKNKMSVGFCQKALVRLLSAPYTTYHLWPKKAICKLLSFQ